MIDHRENDLLRKALSLYAGETVLSRVLGDGEGFLVPNAQTIELTLLFYDVASFTEPRKGFTPESVQKWSLAFAETVTRAVDKRRGTFDTFVGDAGSAWWGQDGAADHPAQAVAGAREMIKAVEGLNRANPEEFPAVELMIGIHTGLVSLGNIGSTTRLRYCPMGDAVNLASRLCGMARGHRRQVVLSEDTYARTVERSDIAPIDTIQVKGRPRPVQLYALGHAP